MADKIMRAEAWISAKDAGFAANLAKMGGAAKKFAGTLGKINGMAPPAGLSPKDAAKYSNVMNQAVMMRQASRMESLSTGVVAMAGAAVAAGYAAKKIVDAGADLQHEQMRMKAAGMSADEIADATYESVKLAGKVPNIDRGDIMHFLRNARTIVGSYQEAAEIAEPMLKMRSMVEAAHPGQDLSEEFDKVIKALEIKGVTQNPEEFRGYMVGMSKALNVFGDTLKPSDYYEMFKLGRQSTRGLSEDYMTSVAPTLAQELGGTAAGTAQQAFFNAIVGGHMTKTALAQMQDYGLVDPSKVIKKKGGDLAQVKPGGILGSDLAMANPYRWVQDVLLPAMAKKGVVDPDKIQEIISSLFSKGTAAQLVSLLATQQARIEKDARQVHGAMSYEAADMFNTKDFSVASKNVVTQLENLAQEIGRPFAEQATPAIGAFAKSIGEFTQWVAGQHKQQDEGKPTDFQNWADDSAHRSKYGRTAVHGESFADRDRRENERELADLQKQLTELQGEVQGRGSRGQQSELSRLRTEIARLKAMTQPLPDWKSSGSMTPDDASIPKGPAAFPMSTDYSAFDSRGAPLHYAKVPLPPARPDSFGSQPQQPSPALDLKSLLTGKIEAKLDGHVPVDVTGKVALEGKADVSVKVSVDGPGRVTGLNANSSGNIRASVGATMPDAGAPKR